MGADSTLQDLQPTSKGPVAYCRGWPWTVVGEARYGAVAAVQVVSRTGGAPDLGTLLLPFDRLAAGPGHEPWRQGGRSDVRESVAGWPTVAWPDVWVAAAVEPPIDVLPHQLVPVVAITKGSATRLLLADAVGMGKTIEAGLVLVELAARAAADRVLVLTPASLRDQWVSELEHRFAFRAEVVDRPAFERRRRQAPPEGTAFLPPACHVMSVDFARQPDVLAALTQVTWDVLVVDEAHVAAGDSARTGAVREIAARARVVLLLTATPHNGDEAAFRRLCSLGRLDCEPPIALVRSTRPALGHPTARRREIAVRHTPAEKAARRLLASYLRLLEQSGSSAARLTGIVLRKRALSCPAALASSLRHRLEWIERQPETGDQPRLPFFDGELDDGDSAQPAVLREAPRLGEREREVLSRALEAADRASPDSGKLQLLRRLVRRTRDRAIVFTEYRDTLEAIAAALGSETSVVTLHGGLDRAARAIALGRFTAGDARLLVATDVAAEGLNLQHACRLVVHFELPWTPVRLEQRDGRVDRIGQSHRVHLWRLVGARHHEARVLSALAGRAARIAAAGIDIAGLEPQPGGEPDLHESACMPVGAGGDVVAAARDVILVRRLLWLAGTRRQGRVAGVPWRRLRRRPRNLARGVIVGVLFPRSAPGSRPTLRFVHVALSEWPPGSPSSWLPAVAAIAARRTPPPDDALTRALKARELALVDRAGRDDRLHQRRWQASLFERRAAHIAAAARERTTTRLDEHRRRIAELEAAPLPPSPVIALLVR